MDAAGFILSIAFTLVKSRGHSGQKARSAVLIFNEPRPDSGVVECSQTETNGL